MGIEYQRLVQVAGNVPVSPHVILFDDFEGILNWIGEGLGTGWIVDRFSETNAVMRGNYGLRLATRATAPAAGDWVRAVRPVSLRRYEVVEFSCCFRHATPATTKCIDFCLVLNDGSFATLFEFRWEGGSGKWQYRNLVGAFVDLPGVVQRLNSLCWNFFRFAVSFRESRCKTFQSNSLVLENLDLPLYKIPSTAFLMLRVVLGLSTTAASQQVAYFDDVLVQEVV